MFILGGVLETPGDFGNLGRFWKPWGILEIPVGFGNLGRFWKPREVLETCPTPIISLISQKQNGTFGKYPDFPKVPLN
jgi:hypothetical protein